MLLVHWLVLFDAVKILQSIYINLIMYMKESVFANFDSFIVNFDSYIDSLPCIS